MNYKQRIKELREDNDYSQQEIADLLGIRQNVYSRYETGKNEMSIKLLLKLSEIYKTSTDYILGKTDIKTPYPASKKK